MRIANAPCSWGVLEQFETSPLELSSAQVLDELSSTGYVGTELGHWGFFSTDPLQLRGDLEARQLTLVSAFVPVALSDTSRHSEGEALARRMARFIRAVSVEASLIVISDALAADQVRTKRAGRIGHSDGLSQSGWGRVSAGANRIAHAIQDESGVRTAFHHHCATYVETSTEIGEILDRTSPELVGLCLDTGHVTYGGGDAVEIAQRYRERIWHVHFKDCSPTVAGTARRRGLDYFAAVECGVFCELGKGSVDFRGVVAALHSCGYDDWIVVEQDVLPSMGSPAESAARNRAFLRELGL